ncbi:hypothetical protein DFO67_10448 [Modicisalibacter xianhensis]|uniref:Uncharacterized protein n=1 Tax=Modicisalibacter xianhensis TaxID=442341 RepID=A0A4R8G2W4_9GAMM|nr:hypothetical protein [Halomonas xianhensis]TDX30793.1 hypothetical protein DFO67_10448 [Halomonas xianhensis]
MDPLDERWALYQSPSGTWEWLTQTMAMTTHRDYRLVSDIEREAHERRSVPSDLGHCPAADSGGGEHSNKKENE